MAFAGVSPSRPLGVSRAARSRRDEGGHAGRRRAGCSRRRSPSARPTTTTLCSPAGATHRRTTSSRTCVPAVDLAFTAKHAFFGGGYTAAIQRYRSSTHTTATTRAATWSSGSSRRGASRCSARHLQRLAHDRLRALAGVPFTRTGTRSNDFNAGITDAVTKTAQLTGSYHFQWVDFDNAGQSPLPRCCRAAAHSSVTHRGASRLSRLPRRRLGGTYSARARPRSGSRPTGRLHDPERARRPSSYQLSPT